MASGKAKQRERKRKQAATAGTGDPAAIDRKLAQAMQRAEAGDLAGAARELVDLKKRSPSHAEIRHALGYIRHLQGRDEVAIEELSHAVDLEPEAVAYRNSLAVVLQRAGRLEEAAGQLQAAIEREPGNPVFQFNLGNVLKDSDAFADAAACYRRALTCHPDDPEILNNLGIALTRCDAAADAMALFRRAAALRPDDPQIPYNLGLAYQELGDPAAAFASFGASLDVDEDYHHAVAAIAQLHANQGAIAKAIATYRRLLEMRPDDHVAMRSIAELLRTTSNFAEARRWVARIGELAPDDPDAARMIGGILAEEGDTEGAIAVYRRILDQHPEKFGVWLDLGHLFILMERLDEARDCIERVAAIEPESPRLFYLRSLIAEAEDDLVGAGAFQDECLRLDPDNYIMRSHRGRLHLAVGEIEAGMELYDSRFADNCTAIDDLPAPLWQGEPLAGKRLLIAAEQGVGDEIIFGSCIPDAIRAAGSCIIECDPRLVPLFSRTFPDAEVHPSQKSVDNRFNVRWYGWLSGDRKPDYAIPIGSLPRWFRGSLDKFPKPGGYLTVDPERVAYWRRRLDAMGPGLKVGLCWRSSVSGLERNRYYTSVDDWAPVFTAPGVVPVNLQYDDCREELDHVRKTFGVDIRTMPDLDLYNDFDNMAAMMRALDVVVSVSTIMPYVAAATGQRALAMSIGHDWTLLGTDRYPWLPDLVPLIRSSSEDWSVVIGDIVRRIGVMVAENRTVDAA